MYPYPIKDWRNESEYIDYGKRHATWAWEFMRRSYEYQKDYDKYFGGRDAKLRTFLEPSLPFFSIAQKYGLGNSTACMFPSPKSDECIFWGRHGDIETATWNESGDQRSVKVTNEYDLVVKFDLRRPLKMELRLLKGLHEGFAEMNGFKVKEERIVKRLYINYLRVLDALADNITIKEIADYMLPHEPNDSAGRNASKKVEGWKKEAIRLRDGGYRTKLLLMPK